MANKTNKNAGAQQTKPKKSNGGSKKDAFAIVVVVLVAIVAAWIFTLDTSEFQSFTPADRPKFEGALHTNAELGQAKHIELAFAPETIDFDDNGNLYATSWKPGGLVRIPKGSNKVERIVTLPFNSKLNGFDFERLNGTKTGRIIAAELSGGRVVAIDPSIKDESKRLIPLINPKDPADGIPLTSVNDIAVADDGTIYFTNSGQEITSLENNAIVHSVLRLATTGRLLKYDPKTKKTTTLITGLGLANGVCVDHDQSSVLVTESSYFRIRRYWINGPNKGKTEIFADNLPGYPDNIRRSSDGQYWLAINTIRSSVTDAVTPYARIRAIVDRFPGLIVPSMYGLILKLDGKGTITKSLHDITGNHVGDATCATEHDNSIYIGNNIHNWGWQYVLENKKSNLDL